MSKLDRPYSFGQATFYPLYDLAYCAKLAGWVILLSVIASLPFMLPSALGMPLNNIFGVVFGLLSLLLLWAVYASYITAFHKRSMKNENGGSFPLRFGKTECHVMLVQFVWLMIFLIIYSVTTIGLGFVRIAGASLASEGGATGVAGGALIVASIFGTALILVYALGRLCAVTPMTVYFSRFKFSDTFQATQKKAWWVVLSFFIIGLIYLTFVIVSFSLIIPLFNQGTSQNYRLEPVIIILSFLLSFVLVIVHQMFTGVGAYMTKTFYNQLNIDQIASLYD